MSALYKLNKNDFVRSLTSAFFVAAVAVLYGVSQQTDFNIFTADWVHISKMVANAFFLTFMGRIGEKTVTDSNGKVFGRIG